MAPPRKLDVGFIGLGYVGLCTAACLASRGFKVHGADVDKVRVATLNSETSPIHEEGLDRLLRSSMRKGDLSFRTDLKEVARCSVIFITVGTPSREDGSVDTQFVEAASRDLGRHLASARGYRLVVVKSTVPPGTTEGTVRPILERESKKRAGKDFGLASNPEFLHEGNAIAETFRPDALVIGGIDRRSNNALLGLYESFYSKLPRPLVTSPPNAEMMKYAINAGRAAQLSFVNTIANLCSRVPGCDYDEVRKGLSAVAKMDHRYLSAGMGYGGSCVPPDTRVITDAGFKLISAVRIGERVLSHDGCYHEVTRTFARNYDGMMYLLKAQGFSSTPLLVTPEHPILSRPRSAGGRPGVYETTVPGRGLIQKMSSLYLVEPPSFVLPSTLSHGDFMVLPAFREDSGAFQDLVMESTRRIYEVPLCPDTMYLFGLWLAEGFVDTRRGEVLFSFHAKETYFLREIDAIVRRYLGVRAVMKKSASKGNSLVVRVKCVALARFLERTFGRGAENKRVPWDWLRLPNDLLASLMRGLWYGDGSNSKNRPYPSFTYASTSKDLADFVEVAFLKLRIPYRRRIEKEEVDSKGVHHRQAYYFKGVDNSIMNNLLPMLKVPLATQRHMTSWFEGNNYVFPIEDIQVVKYSGTVHNLEVEGSNSYVVDGATLHNCLPKDSRALLAKLKSSGVNEEMVASALRVNEGQVAEAIRLAERLCGSMDGKHVSVLGLAFKAGTDDIRESVAVALVRVLIRTGAEVRVYDPVAMKQVKALLGSQVAYARSAKDCLKGSECAFIATGWDEFKKLRPKDFKELMSSPAVMDGRRIFDNAKYMKAGVKIATMGTGPLQGERPGDDGFPPGSRKWHYTLRSTGSPIA